MRGQKGGMSLVATYHETIEHILAYSGASDKTVHVHVGLALYLLGQLVLRTRRGSVDALLFVLVVESANEMMDRLYFGDWRWADTSTDVIATLFWPTLLLLASRYRRARWRRANRPISAAELLRRATATHPGLRPAERGPTASVGRVRRSGKSLRPTTTTI